MATVYKSVLYRLQPRNFCIKHKLGRQCQPAPPSRPSPPLYCFGLLDVCCILLAVPRNSDMVPVDLMVGKYLVRPAESKGKKARLGFWCPCTQVLPSMSCLAFVSHVLLVTEFDLPIDSMFECHLNDKCNAKVQFV